MLIKELNGVFDMRAVAVGVVFGPGQRLDAEEGGGEEEEDEEDEREDVLLRALDDDEDAPLLLPQPSPAPAVPQSEDLLKPGNLLDKNGREDRRLWDLWQCLKNEDPEDNTASTILSRCYFDVPRYMLEIRNHLLDKSQWLKYDDCTPEMLAGGSTQMGKTMFVVIGVCVAKKLEAASVVITHKVAGRNSLAIKIKDALLRLNRVDRLGQLNPQCIAYAGTGETAETRRITLENNDCIVISDTASQITEARGSVYSILSDLQRSGTDKGRFILFKDEADSMLRTQDRHLRLEESIDKLALTTSSYHGVQLMINISATLMPVFLEMARTMKQPRGPIFLTSVPDTCDEKYSGVDRFQPIVSADSELHPELDDEATNGPREVFLDPSLSRDSDSLGINKQ
eukprot:7389924-Prymnesium_polylepis.1